MSNLEIEGLDMSHEALDNALRALNEATSMDSLAVSNCNVDSSDNNTDDAI